MSLFHITEQEYVAYDAQEARSLEWVAHSIRAAYECALIGSERFTELHQDWLTLVTTHAARLIDERKYDAWSDFNAMIDRGIELLDSCL